MMKTYTELSKLPTFRERFEYLKLGGVVGEETFAFRRMFNQKFYNSYEWKRIRDKVIARDYGRDLGLEGYDIYEHDLIIIHHMNPITMKDLEEHSDIVLNPEFLITVRDLTHRAIHFGDISLLDFEVPVRSKYDTCPWRK